MNAMERRYVHCNARLARAKARYSAADDAHRYGARETHAATWRKLLRAEALLKAAEKAARSASHALCYGDEPRVTVFGIETFNPTLESLTVLFDSDHAPRTGGR